MQTFETKPDESEHSDNITTEEFKAIVNSTTITLDQPYIGYFNSAFPQNDGDYLLVEIGTGTHSIFLLPDLAVAYNVLLQETAPSYLYVLEIIYLDQWEYGVYEGDRYLYYWYGTEATTKTDTIAESIASQKGWSVPTPITFLQADFDVQYGADVRDPSGWYHTGKFLIDYEGSALDWVELGLAGSQQDAGRYLISLDESTGLRSANWGENNSWINVLPQPVNHPPTLATPTTVSIIDTAADDSFGIVSGTLEGSDEDGDLLSYGPLSEEGKYGTLTVDKDTGAYTYTPNNEAIQGLKTNDSETFTLTVTDGEFTAFADFTVNVTGANDKAIFSGDLEGSITKGESSFVSGTLIVTDRDKGDDKDVIPQFVVDGSYGTFSINADGGWDYRAGTPALPETPDGETWTDTFTVTTKGGDSQAIVISIIGSNISWGGFGQYNDLDFSDPDFELPAGLAPIREIPGEGLTNLPFSPDPDMEVWTSPHFDFDPDNGYATKDSKLIGAGKAFLADLLSETVMSAGQKTLEELADDSLGNYAPNLGIKGIFNVWEFKQIWTPKMTQLIDNLERQIYLFNPDGTNDTQIWELDKQNQELTDDLHSGLTGWVIKHFAGKLASYQDEAAGLEDAYYKKPFIDTLFNRIAVTANETESFTVSLIINNQSDGVQVIGADKKDVLVGFDGNDSLAGLSGDDMLLGGGGNDRLYGGDDNDQLAGGVGNDYLDGGNGNDILAGGEGNDTLDGGRGSDVIDGGAGDDTLHVQTDGGEVDTLTGGAGKDTFILHPLADGQSRITDFATGTNGDALNIIYLLDESIGYTSGDPFFAAQGYLRLLQSGADTLLQWDKDGAKGGSHTWQTIVVLANTVAGNVNTTANIVNKAVSQTLIGTDSNDALASDAGNDSLYGGAGNDVLVSGSGYDTLDGGPGADTLAGGTGGDFYIVNDPNDQVIEIGNTDGNTSRDLTIFDGPIAERLEKFYIAYYGRAADYDGLSYWKTTLTTVLNNEQIKMCGYFGNPLQTEFKNLYGTGNTNDTFLTNVYLNLFNRGPDADGLNYWKGVITQLQSQGRSLDDARATVVIFVLDGATGADAELIATKTANATALSKVIARYDDNDNAYGNADNTTIFENARDWLKEQGSANFGTGSWAAFYNNSADDILGIHISDVVGASIDWTLGDYLEDLILTGSNPINGTGNALNNTLVGNAASNILTGGAGQDSFVFDKPLGPTNIDTLADFNPTEDKIVLVKDVFYALSLGSLKAAAFHAGTAAHDLDDRIVYNSANGNLSYDPDGTGTAAAQVFAVLPVGIPLTHANIEVV